MVRLFFSGGRVPVFNMDSFCFPKVWSRTEGAWRVCVHTAHAHGQGHCCGLIVAVVTLFFRHQCGFVAGVARRLSARNQESPGKTS
ncbi:hypothetical protein [Undibacterium sp. TS12]|uniref:hypothetical protein n=1 Tax=Undibacterium sp. TS12 TaxID=2908202 RepID=UPI001F4CEC77|nr:hypothetical protein [Undibacterium sp. TS12]MCH8622766.1 hypothetical protein [Undibacterium sp. TS12]